MELTSQGFPVLTILRKTEVSCEHFRWCKGMYIITQHVGGTK
jgi:hypothetical protein